MSTVVCRFEFAAVDQLFTVNGVEFQMLLERFDMCGVFTFTISVSLEVGNKRALRVDQE